MDTLMKLKNPEDQTRFLKQLAKDLPVLNCTINNCVRFCDKCQVSKNEKNFQNTFLCQRYIPS
jgi:hypothetical protein